MPYMISLMPLGFYLQEKKEKKGCKLWAWTVSEQIYKKRDAERSVAAAGLFIKQWFQAFACSYHGLEPFLFFPSFIYTFRTYITSLSSESVTTSRNHYKPWYFLFLVILCFKIRLMQPHRVPAVTDASS